MKYQAVHTSPNFVQSECSANTKKYVNAWAKKLSAGNIEVYNQAGDLVAKRGEAGQLVWTL